VTEGGALCGRLCDGGQLPGLSSPVAAANSSGVYPDGQRHMVSNYHPWAAVEPAAKGLREHNFYY
jgi:hypothetical protein